MKRKRLARAEYAADLALVRADRDEAVALIGAHRVAEILAEEEQKQKQREYMDWFQSRMT